MYAQVWTSPNIACTISVPRRFQLNTGIDHWKDAKKVMRYFQRTKNFMLVFYKCDELKTIGYVDSYFLGNPDDMRFSYMFKLVGGTLS